MLSKTCLIVFLSCLYSITALREKRLVLHSDSDIATEVLKMKSEIASLTATVKNLIISHKTEMASLNTSFRAENGKLHGDINILKGTLTKVTNNGKIFVSILTYHL